MCPDGAVSQGRASGSHWKEAGRAEAGAVCSRKILLAAAPREEDRA